MILKRFLFLIALVIIIYAAKIETASAQASAQANASSAGTSLEAEIQNIEKIIARQGISPAERHDALVRLARLRQLSGNIEGAARNWLEAAGAIPGRVDDEALLNCAFCLAAMGEWDRAIAALEPLVQKNNVRARFLDLSVKAIKTGDISALAVIADNSEYSSIKAEIFFVLWKISRGGSGERWRQRLVTEFPQTPEGRLAAGVSSSIVIVRPSPFWLFANGLDSLPLVAGASSASAVHISPASQPSVTQPPSQPAPAAQTMPAPQPAPASQTAPATQVAPAAAVQTARLQTGIFSREANVQAQVTSLRNAGFTPSVEQRTVNNTPMWAVTVPVGADQTRTMNALRAAGFESFLVR